MSTLACLSPFESNFYCKIKFRLYTIYTLNHFHLNMKTTSPNNSHKHRSPSVPVNYSLVARSTRHIQARPTLPVPFIISQITSTRWMYTAATCDRSGVSRIRHATRPTFIYNCNRNWGPPLIGAARARANNLAN